MFSVKLKINFLIGGGGGGGFKKRTIFQIYSVKYTGVNGILILRVFNELVSGRASGVVLFLEMLSQSAVECHIPINFITVAVRYNCHGVFRHYQHQAILKI